MENNRICFAIPSLNLGGMERVTIEIANFIKNNSDYEVTIIKLAKSEKNFYEVPAGVTLVEPDFLFNRKLRIYHSFKLLFFLIKTIKQINPVSILSFGEMYNSFVLLSSFFTNTKYFVSDRSQPDRNWGFFHIQMRKLLYGRAFGIVAQTTYAKKYLEKELEHRNIKVIPNPLRRNDYEIGEKDKIILYVGRLIASKRVDLLIDAFEEVSNSDWKLWIVGDGPEFNKLENKITNLKTRSLIKFFGAKKNVGEFYSKAKIFAFTSISEGFPNVLIEAQSYGLPIISFDCIAGPADIINDAENGFLIPLLNTKEFSKKLVVLMTDETLLMKMSADALSSSKKFNVDEISLQYFKFMIS